MRIMLRPTHSVISKKAPAECSSPAGSRTRAGTALNECIAYEKARSHTHECIECASHRAASARFVVLVGAPKPKLRGSRFLFVLFFGEGRRVWQRSIALAKASDAARTYANRAGVEPHTKLDGATKLTKKKKLNATHIKHTKLHRAAPHTMDGDEKNQQESPRRYCYSRRFAFVSYFDQSRF